MQYLGDDFLDLSVCGDETGSAVGLASYVAETDSILVEQLMEAELNGLPKKPFTVRREKPNSR